MRLYRISNSIYLPRQTSSEPTKILFGLAWKSLIQTSLMAFQTRHLKLLTIPAEITSSHPPSFPPPLPQTTGLLTPAPLPLPLPHPAPRPDFTDYKSRPNKEKAAVGGERGRLFGRSGVIHQCSVTLGPRCHLRAGDITYY